MNRQSMPKDGILATRLARAYGTWPSPREWRGTLRLLAAFAAPALPIAAASGLIRGPATWLRADACWVLPGALLWPSLTEETLFRVLLYPHPTETASCRPAQALSSLALYIALHHINARLLRPAARGVFDAPAFLLLAGMLGGLNLGLYQRTGSVWPPVLTHWLTVAAWLYFGGKTQLRA